MYQFLLNDEITDEPATAVKRLSDNVFIPFDLANRDYQEYLEWVDEGNTAEAAD